MNRATEYRSGIFCLLCMALLVFACTQPRPVGPQPPAVRVIVKFTDAAQLAPERLQVERPAGKPLVLRHERVMSGNAHLYTGRVREAQRAIVIEALNRRRDVDYAEADHRLSY